MGLNPFRWRSLKTRATLYTLTIFLVGIWILVYHVSQWLREDMQRVLGKQQFSTVSFVATEANRALTERLDALGKTAGMLDPAGLDDPAAFAEFLEARPVLGIQFNGGIVSLGLDGTVLAEIPVLSGRIGVDYMDVEGVAAALKDGKSTIGQPFVDRIRKVPMFAMTVPVRDSDGNVIGALSGLTDLTEPGFLDQIVETYIGHRGYFTLVAPTNRQIVTATGRSRIMEPLPAPGRNPLMDRFVDGSDETGVMLNGNDVEVLASSRRIPVAGWFIVAALPTEEAFALIHNMRRRMFDSTLLLSVLAGGLTWWMLRRELLPMLATIKTLATLSANNLPPQPLPIARDNEIGELIGGFNRLLDTLAQRETALHESEERFKALHDASFGGIAIHDAGIIRDCNQGLSDLTGYTFNELIGMDGLHLIAPEYRETVATNLSAGSEQRYDAEGLRKDGSRYHLSIRGKRIPYKGKSLRVTEFRDITENKKMEEQIRQLAFHDALTRLPNRRLLSDRLGQAMAASKRTGSYCALMFLDLDNFKPLNDAHGHEVGDLLLVEVADRLNACVRETDTVARFGGDEFVVLLRYLDADQSESATQARNVAEKIRTALAAPYFLKIVRQGEPEKTVEHRCSASIGAVLFVNHEISQDEILKRADTAMYQAKEAGRNMVRFHVAG
jgi:diguanylate cyclase (GGDEF)-like protein/PAS domain S-box-containing protein